MSSIVRTLILGSLSLLAMTTAVAAAEVESRDMVVDRVVLSTSGLAGFEMKGRVEEDGALAFPVRLAQVDDVLKSLVVIDPKGALRGVTLPGQQPLEEIFRDLPFKQGDLADTMALLNAYRGATLSVKGAPLTATGKIVHVVPEETFLKEGRVIVKHRLTLLTEGGLRQVLIEDLDSFELTEAKPQAELARALAAVRESGSSDVRTLTVQTSGDSTRDVRLSYVVDAPVWKAAYRFILPAQDTENDGLLQGWAIIENMTASDWRNVDLTLISGNPVTYRQALYPAYYVSRPELPVQVLGRLLPRVDAGALATAAQAESVASEESATMDGSGAADMRVKSARRSLRTAAAPQAMAAFNSAGIAADVGVDMLSKLPMPTQSSETMTQVLFHFPQTVSLKSGQSMMLPFLNVTPKTERVAVYQADTHAAHPLAAVELKNETETGLPSGILTLYEKGGKDKPTTFVGDAQLPVLERGEKRLIPYALDTKTTISRTEHAESSEDRISVSGGVLRTSLVNRLTTDYVMKAPTQEARTIIIEQPRIGDYKIIQPDPKEVEVTPTHYRLHVRLKSGESKTVSLILENQMWQTYGLDTLMSADLAAYATSRGALDRETRAAFKKLADARMALEDVERARADLDRQRQAIFEDQQRLRQNLESLEGKSTLKDKYMAKLEGQEERIAEIEKQKAKLDTAREEKLKALQALIAEMKF